MALCVNGASAKSGSPTFFTYDDAYVAAKWGSFAGWITLWAMGLPTTPQTTADFCQIDPPTELPTTADYAAIGAPVLALISGAYRRLGNQIKADKWGDLCQCNGPVVGGSTAPCTTYSGHFTTVGGSATACPFGSGCFYMGNSGPLIPQQQFPAGQHHLKLDLTNFSGPMSVYVYTEPGPVTIFQLTGQTSVHINQDVGLTASDWRIAVAGGTLPESFDWTVSLWNASGEASCPGAAIPYVPPANPSPPSGFPSAPAAPTCSTSQDVCNAISALSQKLDWTRNAVDLVQRQAVPFAYLTGPSHSVSSSGEFAVQGILGLSVASSGIPSGLTNWPDHPTSYKPFGWIDYGTADGWTGAIPIMHASQLLLDAPPSATKIGYSFLPGVSSTITELRREF